MRVVDNHRSVFEYVPEGWVSRRMKSAVLKYQADKNEDENPTVLSLTKTGIKVKTDLAFGKSTENYVGHQMVRPEQFVFTPRDFDATPILCGVSNFEGCISNLYIVFDIAKQIEPRFLEYYFWGLKYGYDFFAKLSFGMRYSFNQTQFEHIPLIHPDLATQKAIADFLDRETARIDQLIEKKRRLAALLGEKLEDDILRAVTLGVDPNAELVPEDELEWTSHRPRHWKVYRLKHFFRENTKYSSDGQETLFSLRMKEGLIPHNDVSDKEILPSDLINYKKVFPGQIVMNRMRAAIGLFGLADAPGIVSPDYSIFDVYPSAHAAYFLRLFKTEPMMAAFRLLSKGLGTGHSGFMRLNADNFGRIRVAVPEHNEQRLISDYVEERIGQITHLQTKNDQSINRLREYRAALITAAVTGQIDVSTYGNQGTTDRTLDRIEEEMGG